MSKSKKKTSFSAEVTTNFKAQTINDAIMNDIVDVMNYAASAVTGASVKGKGDRPSQLIGIKNVFEHDSWGTGRPSDAPEPPGVLTGTLRRSFTTKSARKFKGRVIASGGTNVKYARIHEYGLGRHPKRPFMKLGIDSAIPSIKQQLTKIEKRVKERIKRSKGKMS